MGAFPLPPHYSFPPLPPLIENLLFGQCAKGFTYIILVLLTALEGKYI